MLARRDHPELAPRAPGCPVRRPARGSSSASCHSHGPWLDSAVAPPKYLRDTLAFRYNNQSEHARFLSRCRSSVCEAPSRVPQTSSVTASCGTSRTRVIVSAAGIGRPVSVAGSRIKPTLSSGRPARWRKKQPHASWSGESTRRYTRLSSGKAPQSGPRPSWCGGRVLRCQPHRLAATLPGRVRRRCAPLRVHLHPRRSRGDPGRPAAGRGPPAVAGQPLPGAQGPTGGCCAQLRPGTRLG